jgi:MFS family permease
MTAEFVDKIEADAAIGKIGGRIPIKVVAGVVAGNAMEFYDFIAYSFFAVYIGRAFFPAKTAFMSLLLSVGVFGVGFVFRPLGGILIGAYADRAGRRSAMLLTIVLITFGTLGLALTPSYESIGIAAPILLILCRLVQGFALGGEVGPRRPSWSRSRRPARALYSSWQLATQGLAAFVAAAIGAAITLSLGADALAAWGWRVPFLVCLALIPLAIYLWRSMPETIIHDGGEIRPAHDRIGAHTKLLALAVLLVLGGTVSTYVGQYMTTYAIATLWLPPSIALSATVVGGLATAIFALFGGWLSDRVGRRWVMLIPRILLAVLTWPAFLLLSAHPSATALYLVTIMLTAFTGISGAASIVVISELLPRAVRSTGMSIAYAIGVSLFGGTTQFIVTWLIGLTGDPTSPAWYVALTSVVTAGAILALPETRNRALEG